MLLTAAQAYDATVKKFLNRYYDYDGVFGYQCVDVGKYFLHCATGKDYRGTMGNAIDWANRPSKLLTDASVRIKGTAVKQGDIVIKLKNHLALATGRVSATQIEIFEQNGHDGTGLKHPGNQGRYRWIDRGTVVAVWRLKTPKSKAQAVYYKVVKGDTLSKIAKKFKTTWQKLYAKKDNKNVIGSDPDKIKPGQKIDVSK